MAHGLPAGYPPPAAVTRPLRWIHVRRRFDALLEAIGILPNQLQDGQKKVESVTASLHRAYYGVTDWTCHAVLAGSWGRQTRVRPSGDIDLIFVLPYEVYVRFEQRDGNRQSQLLQEVKGVLAQTFTRTSLRADGQVIVVAFDTITIEVVPAFLLEDGRYWICDTNGGGRYTVSDPQALAEDLDAADLATGGQGARDEPLGPRNVLLVGAAQNSPGSLGSRLRSAPSCGAGVHLSRLKALLCP
ncbi:hypothetical protein [Phenylobacterium sp. CCH12-B4]